jgi:hypothetical protein
VGVLSAVGVGGEEAVRSAEAVALPLAVAALVPVSVPDPEPSDVPLAVGVLAADSVGGGDGAPVLEAELLPVGVGWADADAPADAVSALDPVLAPVPLPVAVALPLAVEIEEPLGKAEALAVAVSAPDASGELVALLEPVSEAAPVPDAPLEPVAKADPLLEAVLLPVAEEELEDDALAVAEAEADPESDVCRRRGCGGPGAKALLGAPPESAAATLPDPVRGISAMRNRMNCPRIEALWCSERLHRRAAEGRLKYPNLRAAAADARAVALSQFACRRRRRCPETQRNADETQRAIPPSPCLTRRRSSSPRHLFALAPLTLT